MQMKSSLTKLPLIKFTLFAIFLYSYFSIEAAPVLHKQTSENQTAYHVITKFLQWYKANIKLAHSFPIL